MPEFFFPKILLRAWGETSGSRRRLCSTRNWSRTERDGREGGSSVPRVREGEGVEHRQKKLGWRGQVQVRRPDLECKCPPRAWGERADWSTLVLVISAPLSQVTLWAGKERGGGRGLWCTDGNPVLSIFWASLSPGLLIYRRVGEPGDPGGSRFLGLLLQEGISAKCVCTCAYIET